MFEKVIEAKIQAAMRNGEFDDLPSWGKPIDLDEWARLPEDIRAGYTMLKNAGFIPEEVELLKEIRKLRERLESGINREEKTVILKKLRDAELKYNMTLELRNRQDRPQKSKFSKLDSLYNRTSRFR